MRFLADENCSQSVVSAYRDAGHDVALVRDIRPGTPDPNVLAMSVESGRILLTEDKDFGQLVFLFGQRTCGVVLFRFPEGTRHLMTQKALSFLDDYADRLENEFVTVTPEQVRFASV